MSDGGGRGGRGGLGRGGVVHGGVGRRGVGRGGVGRGNQDTAMSSLENFPPPLGIPDNLTDMPSNLVTDSDVASHMLQTEASILSTGNSGAEQSFEVENSPQQRRCNVAHIISRLSKCFNIESEMSSECGKRLMSIPFSYQEPTQFESHVGDKQILIDIKNQLKIPITTIGCVGSMCIPNLPVAGSGEEQNATVVVEGDSNVPSSPKEAQTFECYQDAFMLHVPKVGKQHELVKIPPMQTRYANSKPHEITWPGKKHKSVLSFTFEIKKRVDNKSDGSKAGAAAVRVDREDKCALCQLIIRDGQCEKVSGFQEKRGKRPRPKTYNICLQCWHKHGVCYPKMKKVEWTQITSTECDDIEATALWYGALGFESHNTVSTLNSLHIGREITEQDTSNASDIEYAVQIVLKTWHSLHIVGEFKSGGRKCNTINFSNLPWSFVETLKKIICEIFNVPPIVMKDHMLELTHTCKWFTQKKMQKNCDACEDSKTASQIRKWLGNALEKNQDWSGQTVRQYPCMCSEEENVKQVTQCEKCLPLFYSFMSITHKHSEVGAIPVQCQCIACWACATLGKSFFTQVSTNDHSKGHLFKGPLRCGSKSLERSVYTEQYAMIKSGISTRVFPSIASRVLDFPTSSYFELMSVGLKLNFTQALIQNLELLTDGFKGQIRMGQCNCKPNFDTICPLCHPFYFQESQPDPNGMSSSISSLQVRDILSNDVVMFFSFNPLMESRVSSHAIFFAHFMVWISERYSIWKTVAVKLIKTQEADLYERFKHDIESIFKDSGENHTYHHNRSSNKSLRVIQLHFDVAVRAAIPSLLNYLLRVWMHAHLEFEDCKSEFQVNHGNRHNIDSILGNIEHAKLFFANEVDVKKFLWDVVRCPRKKRLWANLELTKS